MRQKDPTLTSKIFSIKQANPTLSDRKVAEMLGVNHMTVSKHRRSTEYASLAHELATSNRDKIQEQINLAHDVIVATLKQRNDEGFPTPAAMSMAKALGTTQSSKLLGVRASETETEDRSPEEKNKLIDELLSIRKLSNGSNGPNGTNEQN